MLSPNPGINPGIPRLVLFNPEIPGLINGPGTGDPTHSTLKYSEIIMTVAFGPQTNQHEIDITSSFILAASVKYVYLLCHCRWNKTHFGLLGLISNRWASNTTNTSF